jgi:RimJ/RimL family protein N-acetyltransferase
MTYYLGPPLIDSAVALAGVDLDEVRATAADADVIASKEHWSREAAVRDDVLYFGVRREQALIGHFFLHDIDDARGEALLGYDLFLAESRGRGAGSAALRLLQLYVAEHTPLRKVFAITGNENQASRRMCRRAGFTGVGPSREDPDTTTVFVWPVPARVERR